MKNLESLITKLKNDFQYITGTTYKGIFKGLGNAFASRLYEYYSKVNFITKQAFIETADEDYLYLHAGYLVDRNEGETSKGNVVFYGTENSIIPKDSIIQDSISKYKTLKEAKIEKFIFLSTIILTNNTCKIKDIEDLTDSTIFINNKQIKANTVIENGKIDITFTNQGFTNGQNVQITIYKTLPVEVESVENGKINNRNYNDPLILNLAIPGVNKFCGVLNLTNGKDKENLETYRNRIKYFFRNPVAPFNTNHIISSIINKLENIKYVNVKLINNVVNIFVINKDLDLTNYEIEEIKKIIDNIRPLNIPLNDIIINKMLIKKLDIVINGLPLDSKNKENIMLDIAITFNRNLFEKALRKEFIESVIYKNKNAQNYEFEVIQGFSNKITNTLLTIGTIKIND